MTSSVITGSTIWKQMVELPRSSRRRWTEGSLLVMMIALPLISGDAFFIDRFGKFFLLAIFAISVDLVWGQGGMLTFGHAAFFGGGGYVAAMLTTHDWWVLPLPLVFALPLAVAAAVLLSVGLSSLSFAGRAPLRGVEFAVITLAIAFMLEQLARSGGTVSGGQNGILIDSRLELGDSFSFHRGTSFYVLSATTLVVVYLLAREFTDSRTGLILQGIRENEDRVDRLGYSVTRIKRTTYAVSAAIAALAGVLFYVHDGIISPTAVGVGNSTLVLLWVVLGGRGTLLGPVVGAVVLSYLNSRLSSSFLDTWLLYLGGIMVVAIVLFPAGFLGWLGRGEDR